MRRFCRWWYGMDREARLVLVVAVAIVGVRLAVASLSGFGFHQGWNEGHYAMIGRGFLAHPLVPEYAGRYVYNVPPLFPYAVAVSFGVFGVSELAARLPSVLAAGGLVVATYDLGRSTLRDRRTAAFGAVVLGTLPYVQLYAGRAQTDVMMTFLFTAALAAIVRGYRQQTGHRRWLIAGGALFAGAVAAKQPALILSGVVLAWLLGTHSFDRETLRRTGVLIAASALCLLPLAAWLYLNFRAQPTAFVIDWRHELLGRTQAFANVPLLLAIGAGLGATPPVLAAAAIGTVVELRSSLRGAQVESGRDLLEPSVLLWWLVLYGGFVFARTPHGHQYYAVALAPPVALLAARGVGVAATAVERVDLLGRASVETILVVGLILSTAAGTVLLFELSGEFSAANGDGSHVATDAGAYLTAEVPKDATILVPNGYDPPLLWYTVGTVSADRIETYRVGSFDDAALRRAAAESDGPLYVVYPRPSWGTPPARSSVVHITEPYRYTVMAVVGSVVETDSKFGFYLEDRRLVVYRYEGRPAQEPTGQSRRSRATSTPASPRTAAMV